MKQSYLRGTLSFGEDCRLILADLMLQVRGSQFDKIQLIDTYLQIRMYTFNTLLGLDCVKMLCY